MTGAEFLLLRTEAEPLVHADVVKALERAAPGEAELLGRLKKEDADDEEVKRAIAVARLLSSLSPESRETVRKTYGPPPRKPNPHAGENLLEYIERTGRDGAEAIAKIDERVERMQEKLDADAEWRIEKAADAIRSRDSSLSREQAIRKACESDPELYARYVRHLERSHSSANSLAIGAGANAERRVEQRARDLVAKSALSFEQAYDRVVKEDPELAQLLVDGQRARSRQAEAEPVAKSAERQRSQAAAEQRINEAAERVRKADPSLSFEQAMQKALEQDPDLYAAYRGFA